MLHQVYEPYSNMIRLIIATLFLYQVLGEPIVGGHTCDIQTHPWLVSIYKFGSYSCVGSIISKDIILTAAHCAKDPVISYTVRMGSSRTDSGGSWYWVVGKQQHQNYSRTNTISMNDIGLLKVAPPIEFGDNVTAIQLAGPRYDVKPGTSVIVAGWGSETYTTPAIYDLKSASVYIVDSRECSEAYGDKTGKIIGSSGQICATRPGTDSCKGDSGAPLMHGYVQIGIVSSGIGCADPDYPGVYTEVARFHTWINTHMRLLE